MAQYPENTLEAFRRSAAVVEMIETDVQRCASGELVVFHDETLDRVTDVTGEVASTPLSALKEASVLGTDESIPLLTEVFEAVPPSVGLNLELKGLDVAADAVEIAGRYDHEVIVSSFRPDEVADARDAGAAAVAYLVYADADATDEFDTAEALDVADELGCSYVHPHVHLCLDTEIVERAHARGFGVNAWTAEGSDTIAELRARNVDGVVIDDCGLADECRDE
nr:glycerophosphodiester phosphodiesterase [Halobellus rarus]